MQPEFTTTRQPGMMAHTAGEDLGSKPVMLALSLAARLFLGSVFLVAGADKLGALKTFGKSIAAYDMLPEGIANIVALLFVWTEIVVGLLLIAGIVVRGSSLVTGGMLVVFLIAIVTAIARNLEIDCGCFAGHSEPVGIKKVLEDLALLALAIFLIYFPRSYCTFDQLIGRQRMGGT